MFNVQKDDIIFNHRQTEEILNNGHVTSGGGRGKIVGGDAYTNGTAYAGGTLRDVYANTSGALRGSNTFYNDALNYDGDDDKPQEEDFDWIEVLIQRIEEAIQRVDIVANSAYKSFTKRNNKLAEELKLVNKQIGIQEQAYKAYMREAEAVGLSAEYKKKVQNGKLDIETIVGNEELVEKIKKYQELYDKAIAAKDKILELEENAGDIVKAQFDNIATEFDYKLGVIEDRISNIETGLDIVEAKGNFAHKNYFLALMSAEESNITMLQNKLSSLKTEFNEAMASGKIEKNSEAWYSMKEEICATESAIQEGTLSLIEYQNQMREMDWSAFEYGISLVETLVEESQFLIDLLSFDDTDLTSDKTGKLTNKGKAVGGLRAINYNTYMRQAEEYEKKVKEINKELAEDPYNTKLIDKKNEYVKAQQDSIAAANEEKMAVKDLIQSSYDKMLEILQELIDKRKEALQAEKDLYSYEKGIREQTNEISSFQKQIAALGGDDSEETQAKLQQLQDSLEQAQENLKETEYDQWLTDQEKLMDKMYADYEEVLNERLDNIDGLLTDMIEATNNNADGIRSTIKDAGYDVGYNISEEMKNILTSEDGVSGIVSNFNDKFATHSTTVNNTLTSIYDVVKQIINKSGVEAEGNTNGEVENVKPTTTKPTTTKPTTTKPTTTKPAKPKETNPNNNKGSFFVKKVDYFPKNKLNVNTSIIDRLKYNNLDPSWSNLAMYYEKMGLGKRSDYVGSYSQNVNMVAWMKKNGFKRSGQLSSMISTVKEDGLFLGRKDDTILAKEDWEIASSMVDKLISISALQPNTNAIKGMSYANNSQNNISMNITLPNVQNYDQFVSQLQKDKRFEKIVQSMSIEQSLGKNSLSKFKYK